MAPAGCNKNVNTVYPCAVTEPRRPASRLSAVPPGRRAIIPRTHPVRLLESFRQMKRVEKSQRRRDLLQRKFRSSQQLRRLRKPLPPPKRHRRFPRRITKRSPKTIRTKTRLLRHAADRRPFRRSRQRMTRRIQPRRLHRRRAHRQPFRDQTMQLAHRPARLRPRARPQAQQLREPPHPRLRRSHRPHRMRRIQAVRSPCIKGRAFKRDKHLVPRVPGLRSVLMPQLGKNHDQVARPQPSILPPHVPITASVAQHQNDRIHAIHAKGLHSRALSVPQPSPEIQSTDGRVDRWKRHHPGEILFIRHARKIHGINQRRPFTNEADPAYNPRLS